MSRAGRKRDIILIVADIHGNLPALRAVLAAEPQANRILCLGDLVHYGPDCSRIVSWAQDNLRPGDIVRGNHDEASATGKPAERKGFGHPVPDEITTRTRDSVSAAGKQFLGDLPLISDLSFRSDRWLLTHGLPSDPLHGYLLENGPPRRWSDEVRIAGEPAALLVGHTHRPFLKEVRQTMVVNPGSVGRPKDGDPRASYALWREEKFLLKRAAYEQIDLFLRMRKYFSPDLASRLVGELLSGEREKTSENEPVVIGSI